jgi:hypothetical protein
MNRIYGFIYFFIMSVLFACKKDEAKPELAKARVSLEVLSRTDTLQQEVGVIKDSIVTLGIKAKLNGEPSAEDHLVTFRVDTTYINAYKAKYGNAVLLPYTNYLFYTSQATIPAGSTLSEPIQINLVSQTTLRPETIYVLPIVLKNVDGQVNAVAPNEVLYLVVKSGQTPNISKLDWKIVTYSSQLSATTSPNFLLDNDDQTTYWWSGLQPMPQWVIFDFNSEITFQSVTYRTPTSNYTSGGYPTKVKIEVSSNGTTWTDKGTYNGVTTPITWEQNIGQTTARYMRFTVLEVKLYAGIETVIIGGIGLLR